MKRPERKECKCHPHVRCNCEGWNEACDVWDKVLGEQEKRYEKIIEEALISGMEAGKAMQGDKQ